MRLGLAFRAFFAALAGRPLPPALAPGGDAPALPEPAPPSTADAPGGSVDAVAAAAAQTLGLLQAEGRLLDFLQEDIDGYSDAEVGQVVRDVHRGCRKALRDHFDLEPVRPEGEDASVTVAAGFDPGQIRVVGNVVGKPPFTGTLVHAGYRAAAVRLPRLRTGPSALVVTPAEVEVE